MQDRRICREGDPEWTSGVPVRHETIPVVHDGRVIAVIERSTNLSAARTPSRMDIAYLRAADDLAQMVAAGMFPSTGEEPALVRSPRVGDGLLRLSRSGKVTYASPNALSAYRRLGLTADLVGAELGPLTAQLCTTSAPRDDSLMLTASGRAHMETELEGNGSVVQLRSIPLVVAGARAGALVLVRDVTELRHRERELITKDATIREIHHRVKNNLQTVAALLRLQARRLTAPEARAALEEAVRRVGSIAIVHETLSHAPEEIVDFDDIARRVAMMAGEVSAPETRVTPELSGKFGRLPASLATPLALVLTELLQNALQHGLTRPTGAALGGTLKVTADRGHDRLTVTVADNGVGLPPDFDLDSMASLGLQIVRTLVVAELGGRLDITRQACGRNESDRGSAGRPAVPPPTDGRRRPCRWRTKVSQALAPARTLDARRLSARRSSSLRPPQTPESCPLSSAQARHGSWAGQRWQTCLASSIWSNAGPVFPIGKNSSGSSSRQAAW